MLVFSPENHCFYDLDAARSIKFGFKGPYLTLTLEYSNNEVIFLKFEGQEFRDELAKYFRSRLINPSTFEKELLCGLDTKADLLSMAEKLDGQQSSETLEPEQ